MPRVDGRILVLLVEPDPVVGPDLAAAPETAGHRGTEPVGHALAAIAGPAAGPGAAA